MFLKLFNLVGSVCTKSPLWYLIYWKVRWERGWYSHVVFGQKILVWPKSLMRVMIDFHPPSKHQSRHIMEKHIAKRLITYEARAFLGHVGWAVWGRIGLNSLKSIPVESILPHLQSSLYPFSPSQTLAELTKHQPYLAALCTYPIPCQPICRCWIPGVSQNFKVDSDFPRVDSARHWFS